MRITQPFGFAQGRESLNVARDRELVERHVERQMGFPDSLLREFVIIN
jgi:hypothetical protein